MTPEEQVQAIIDLQATVKAHGETIDDHAKTISGQAVIINDLKSKAGAPGASPAPAKKEKFKGQAATNKDTSGNAENEYHFTKDSKNYKFIADSVSLPPDSGLGAVGTRITAAAAQGSATLQTILVKNGSGQIKEVK